MTLPERSPEARVFASSIDDLRRQGASVEVRGGVLNIVGEASEMRLATRTEWWPQTVQVLAGRFIHELEFRGFDMSGGDVAGARYSTQRGDVTLLVIND